MTCKEVYEKVVVETAEDSIKAIKEALQEVDLNRKSTVKDLKWAAYDLMEALDNLINL